MSTVFFSQQFLCFLQLRTLKSSQKSPEEESRVSEKQCLENDEALTFLGMSDRGFSHPCFLFSSFLCLGTFGLEK